MLAIIFQTGTLTEGKPAVTSVASFAFDESEILQIAAAVEKTTAHPIAKAIIDKAQSLNLTIPVTRGQLVEPGFGTLAEVDGRFVAVGNLEWVNQCFQVKADRTSVLSLEQTIVHQSSESSRYSRSVVYVGREEEGIIGAIAISDNLRQDAEATMHR